MIAVDLPLLATPAELHSTLDASVNFVTPIAPPMEALEARFVRRSEDYIVVYLSPQTACAQACRFYHLTATGQVKGRDASLEELEAQAQQVLDYYASDVASGNQPPARLVHYNFMARGEALVSETMLKQGDAVMEMLFRLAKNHRLTPAVKISTIGSDRFDRILDVFPYEQPDLYYSIYSLDPIFRRRWLPNAPEPLPFLEKLLDWQVVTRKIPTLHHAVIEGENDSLRTVQEIITAVDSVGLRVNVNLVRYNPPSPRHGREASEERLDQHIDMYRDFWPTAQVNLIKKVGFDVAASCGMFVGGREAKGK